MTQDEIIRMAREAGIETLHIKRDGEKHSILDLCYPELERFAALVAAHVTEALTKSHEAAFQSYVDQAKADRELETLAARLDEREACAKVCEGVDEANKGFPLNAKTYVAAIRARGEK